MAYSIKFISLGAYLREQLSSANACTKMLSTFWQILQAHIWVMWLQRLHAPGLPPRGTRSHLYVLILWFFLNAFVYLLKMLCHGSSCLQITQGHNFGLNSCRSCYRPDNRSRFPGHNRISLRTKWFCFVKYFDRWSCIKYDKQSTYCRRPVISRAKRKVSFQNTLLNLPDQRIFNTCVIPPGAK